MGTQESKKNEIIMAGLGGKGVLTIGQVLSAAVLPQYDYVSYFPSYGGGMRGDVCECTVIFSQSEIDSPIITYVDTIIIVEASQIGKFEYRVKKGGRLFTEIAGLDFTITRQDINIIKIPAVDIALKAGDPLAANFVLLGAYIGSTNMVDSRLVEEEIAKRYHANARLLQVNQRAFRAGIGISALGKPNEV